MALTHTRAYAIVVSSIFLLILIYLFNTFAQTCDRSEFYMCIQRVNHIQWQNEMKLKMHFMQKGNLQCLRLSRRTTNTHTRAHPHIQTEANINGSWPHFMPHLIASWAGIRIHFILHVNVRECIYCVCMPLFVFVYLRVRVCDCTYILINPKAKQMSHNGPTCGQMVSMEGGAWRLRQWQRVCVNCYYVWFVN